MNPLTLTRTMLAEHSYPEPTRNHLSMHNREAAKRRASQPTKGSEVRFGYRAKDGTNYMFPTASEMAAHRQMKQRDELLRKQQHAARIAEMVSSKTAETDSWAHKS